MRNDALHGLCENQKIKTEKNSLDLKGFKACFSRVSFIFFRVRNKIAEFEGLQGTSHEKEKIQGIFKGVRGFKYRWSP